MKLICTLQAIEESFSAAAFAEENEHQAARDMLRRRQEGVQKAACQNKAGGTRLFDQPQVLPQRQSQCLG